MSKYFIVLFLLLTSFVRAQDLSTDLNPGHANHVLPCENYRTIRGGLPHFQSVIRTKTHATIAFLGGSITYNPGWREKVGAFLQAQYPTIQFHFINAGIPSLGSFPHTFRVQRDVLDSGKIDLMFLEAAVNDRVNGIYGYDSLKQLRALEGIVRHVKKKDPSTDIVMMSFADPDKTNDYKKSIVPTEISNHELVAAHYNLPSINLAKEVADKMSNGEFSWDKDFKDIHPSPFGQALYFQNIKALLNDCLSNTNFSKKQFRKMPRALDKYSYTEGYYANIKLAQYDSAWKLEKAWMPKDGLSTRDGFVHVPMLVTESQDATLTFPFMGNAIGMALVSGSDAGIVAYAIDGAPYKEIDLYTPWSNMLHLPWYVLFGDVLKTGKHVLHLKTLSKKNEQSKGNACRIVYFLVNKKSF